MAKLRHVQSGDPLSIPAADYNAMADAARAHERQQGREQPPPALPLRGRRSYSSIRILNETGTDLGQHHIVSLRRNNFAGLVNPGDYPLAPVVRAELPSGTNAFNHGYAVTLEPIKALEIGWAAIDGIVPIRIKSDSSAGLHRWAVIEEGETSYLVASQRGGTFDIVEAVSATEPEGWGLIRLPGRVHSWAIPEPSLDQFFEADGELVVPAGVWRVFIMLVGGGAGGQGGYDLHRNSTQTRVIGEEELHFCHLQGGASGGGGPSGAVVWAESWPLAPGTYQIVIGAGGAGGQAGGTSAATKGSDGGRTELQTNSGGTLIAARGGQYGNHGPTGNGRSSGVSVNAERYWFGLTGRGPIYGVHQAAGDPGMPGSSSAGFDGGSVVPGRPGEGGIPIIAAPSFSTPGNIDNGRGGRGGRGEHGSVTRDGDSWDEDMDSAEPGEPGEDGYAVVKMWGRDLTE